MHCNGAICNVNKWEKIAFRIHFILIDKKGEQSFFRKDVSPVLSFHKQEIPKVR